MSDSSDASAAKFTTIHMPDGSRVELPNSLTGRPVNRIDLLSSNQRDDTFIANQYQKIVVKNARFAKPGMKIPIPGFGEQQQSSDSKKNEVDSVAGDDGSVEPEKAGSGGGGGGGGEKKGTRDNHTVLYSGVKVPQHVHNEAIDLHFDFGADGTMGDGGKDLKDSVTTSPPQVSAGPPLLLKEKSTSSKGEEQEVHEEAEDATEEVASTDKDHYKGATDQKMRRRIPISESSVSSVPATEMDLKTALMAVAAHIDLAQVRSWAVNVMLVYLCYHVFVTSSRDSSAYRPQDSYSRRAGNYIG